MPWGISAHGAVHTIYIYAYGLHLVLEGLDVSFKRAFFLQSHQLGLLPLELIVHDGCMTSVIFFAAKI